MNDITTRKIKSGGDPRMLPDYAALRDELSHKSHEDIPMKKRFSDELIMTILSKA